MTDQTHQIPAQLQTGKDLGMQLLDQALLAAIQARRSIPTMRTRYAIDKQPFAALRHRHDTLMPKLEVTQPSRRHRPQAAASTCRVDRRIPARKC